MEVKVSWKVTFEMKAVSDGGLVIQIVHKMPEVKIDGQIWYDDQHPFIRSRYETAGNNIAHVLKGMEDALKGGERFFFPVSTLGRTSNEAHLTTNVEQGHILHQKPNIQSPG